MPTLPASVTTFFSEVLKIINLELLKELVAERLGSVAKVLAPVLALGGLAFAGLGILLAVFLLSLLYKYRNSKFINKIWRTVFWNFLIRYYMTVYLGFWFSALSSIKKDPITGKVTGAFTLLVMTIILVVS